MAFLACLAKGSSKTANKPLELFAKKDTSKTFHQKAIKKTQLLSFPPLFICFFAFFGRVLSKGVQKQLRHPQK
jgi:hypothetical protein